MAIESCEVLDFNKEWQDCSF